VLEGSATLDESLLTGESLPVTRQVGSTVYAGTILREGSLICQVTSPPGSTRLSQIAELVSQTLSQKPRIQRLADQASTYFAYAILLLALLTFMGWYLRTHSISSAIMTAVAVLVVACPCALGLATPLVMTVAMGSAARRGILVRSPQALETSASIQRIVFDKTGTLTQGHFAVIEVVTATGPGLNKESLLRLAASVEQFSEHPLAQAIVQSSHAPPFPTSDFMSLRGVGASARVENGITNQRVSVGSNRLVDAGQCPELLEIANQHASEGETVIWVDRDGQLAGFISLRDQPNPTACEALKQLSAGGVEPTMLSGDSTLAAQAVAHELGIRSYEGNCSPEDKARRIASWQQQGLKVAMTGDGVNDAPALALANLSITVAGGTDIAGEASDLVLTRSDLALIPWFIQISRRTRQTILQNLVWAFTYNLISVPLAMFGLISPVIAAAAMAISSLLVVGNSLKMRRY
jgi:heavy metal translocating P-type ATPase